MKDAKSYVSETLHMITKATLVNFVNILVNSFVI